MGTDNMNDEVAGLEAWCRRNKLELRVTINGVSKREQAGIYYKDRVCSGIASGRPDGEYPLLCVEHFSPYPNAKACYLKFAKDQGIDHILVPDDTGLTLGVDFSNMGRHAPKRAKVAPMDF